MQPVFERFGSKLTAVIRADKIRQAFAEKQITDDIQHVIGFQRRSNTDRQTLARVHANHCQHADLLAA